MADFTELLNAAEGGRPQAAADLFSLVYEDLRRLAGQHLAQERSGHTLQPTALVHEVYLRLFGGPVRGLPAGETALEEPPALLRRRRRGHAADPGRRRPAGRAGTSAAAGGPASPWIPTGSPCRRSPRNCWPWTRP